MDAAERHQLLPDDVGLTVLTNSLPNATAPASRSRVTVHLIGRRVRGTTMSAVDRWGPELVVT